MSDFQGNPVKSTFKHKPRYGEDHYKGSNFGFLRLSVGGVQQIFWFSGFASNDNEAGSGERKRGHNQCVEKTALFA
jgi:hypothetical protein